MRTTLAALAVSMLAGCASAPRDFSDAPVERAPPSAYPAAASHAEALQAWRDANDINAFIGARFEYDRARALQLSETQRAASRVPIHEPAAFFADPRGVCVDLARFAVETLRAIEPASGPAFVMIEFEPVTVAGNTLRRHWLASYRRPEGIYFFADSKRPGHVAGPYASVASFMADYQEYRGRKVVSFRELDSHERKVRVRAAREDRPNAR
jgi:hypothetical protein